MRKPPRSSPTCYWTFQPAAEYNLHTEYMYHFPSSHRSALAVTLVCRRGRRRATCRTLLALRQAPHIRILPAIARCRRCSYCCIRPASTRVTQRARPARHKLMIDKLTWLAGANSNSCTVVALIWDARSAPAKFGEYAAAGCAHARPSLLAVAAAGLAGEAGSVAAATVPAHREPSSSSVAYVSECSALLAAGREPRRDAHQNTQLRHLPACCQAASTCTTSFV
jgi:hypothetical protein